MICGHCKHSHATIAQVRACYGLEGANAGCPAVVPAVRQAGARPNSPQWKQRYAMPSHFDADTAAELYLVSNEGLRALKIGVTAGGRVDEHAAHGWEIVDRWWFSIGYDAVSAEELVLDRWRNLFRLRPVVSSGQMPQGGASETVADSPNARADTIEFVRELIENHLGLDQQELEKFAFEDWGYLDSWDQTG